MKLISWNVNGIRAVIKKGFYDFVATYNPDILCIQETKAHPEQVDLTLSDYPYQYWNSAEKKGYSGTAIFSKVEPLSINYDMGIKKHDLEGRVITAEFKDYFLVTVYTPNSKRELLRLDYRQKEWDVDFLKHLKDICGENLSDEDLNIASSLIELGSLERINFKEIDKNNKELFLSYDILEWKRNKFKQPIHNYRVAKNTVKFLLDERRTLQIKSLLKSNANKVDSDFYNAAIEIIVPRENLLHVLSL